MNIEKFYKENYKRHVNVVKKSLKFNKHYAEDIVQQAYIKAMTNEKQFNPKKGKFHQWFNKILFNELRDFQRKNFSTVSLNENLEVNPENTEAILIVQFELELVKSKKHRQVLELFYIAGYSSSQISSLYPNMTRSNVTTICNRFRRTIRDKYGVNL